MYISFMLQRPAQFEGVVGPWHFIPFTSGIALKNKSFAPFTSGIALKKQELHPFHLWDSFKKTRASSLSPLG
jgi:hypothetical protein